jgi:hypothetical protein
MLNPKQKIGGETYRDIIPEYSVLNPEQKIGGENWAAGIPD